MLTTYAGAKQHRSPSYIQPLDAALVERNA